MFSYLNQIPTNYDTAAILDYCHFFKAFYSQKNFQYVKRFVHFY